MRVKMMKESVPQCLNSGLVKCVKYRQKMLHLNRLNLSSHLAEARGLKRGVQSCSSYLFVVLYVISFSSVCARTD